jgi:UDP-N-acetyl-D-galactosamine dehydrogenase
VGGHCIGVDPYYLTYQAQQLGYNPEVILAGRSINDSMGDYVADRTVEAMKAKNVNIKKSRILILGLTFKENCPDLRNSKVLDIINNLNNRGAILSLNDILADRREVQTLYGKHEIISLPLYGKYDAVILAVPHEAYLNRYKDAILNSCKPDGIIFDVKSVLGKGENLFRL